MVAPLGRYLVLAGTREPGQSRGAEERLRDGCGAVYGIEGSGV